MRKTLATKRRKVTVRSVQEVLLVQLTTSGRQGKSDWGRRSEMRRVIQI